MKTYLSTDWIVVGDSKSEFLAKVFLTDDGRAYMIGKSPKEIKFFKVDAGLLRLGELGFFEKVMDRAEELPIKQAVEMGLVSKDQPDLFL